ncbi:MAG TPA: RDD family protein [Dokdonella sp.]
MENATYALVLTGAVLPGHSPDTVWPALAEYFRIEPERLREQVLARAPLTIKQGDDLGKLQALQAGAAAAGAEAELCAPDGRAPVFVVIDGTARGPLPRVFVDERVRRGAWPDALPIAEVGSNAWSPYRESLVPPPLPVVAEPADAANTALVAAAGAGDVAPTSTRPHAGVGEALPPGAAIHAGFWRRSAAYVIDYVVTLVLAYAITVAAGAGLGFTSSGDVAGAAFGTMIGGVLGIVVGWLYFALQESSAAQATLGKRAMSLKVTDDYGHRIGFGRASGRFFGKILSGVILAIGFMLAGWTARKQALHDLLAGTLVVFRSVRPGEPLPQVRPPMPWYGWALNALLILSYLGIGFASVALFSTLSQLGGAGTPGDGGF